MARNMCTSASSAMLLLTLFGPVLCGQVFQDRALSFELSQRAIDMHLPYRFTTGGTVFIPKRLLKCPPMFYYCVSLTSPFEPILRRSRM